MEFNFIFATKKLQNMKINNREINKQQQQQKNKFHSILFAVITDRPNVFAYIFNFSGKI